MSPLTALHLAAAYSFISICALSHSHTRHTSRPAHTQLPCPSLTLRLSEDSILYTADCGCATPALKHARVAPYSLAAHAPSLAAHTHVAPISDPHASSSSSCTVHPPQQRRARPIVPVRLCSRHRCVEGAVHASRHLVMALWAHFSARHPRTHATESPPTSPPAPRSAPARLSAARPRRCCSSRGRGRCRAGA